MINPLKINPLDVARQALLPGSADAQTAAHQQRVEQLFRNRAELKKAYSEVQDELFRLKDRLKQQEAATARVQEILQHLEARLEAPETAWSVVVFFHLRRLWRIGTNMLQQYALDLERQHVDRERRAWLAALNREQFARRQQAEAAARQAEGDHSESTQRLLRLQRERASLTRPWHHFRRKALVTQIAAAEASHHRDEAALEEARGVLAALAQEGEAPFPGLSVEARRAINLAVIAYAELLCSRVGQSPIVAQARAATRQSEATDEFGTRKDCEALMSEVARLQGLIEQGINVGNEVRSRTEALAKVATYAGPDETIPQMESLHHRDEDVLQRTPRGARAPRQVNVLEEESWDVLSALRR